MSSSSEFANPANRKRYAISAEHENGSRELLAKTYAFTNICINKSKSGHNGCLHSSSHKAESRGRDICVSAEYFDSAAEEATDSALAAGASAGAVNAAAAAPVGKQLSAKQSKKLER